MDKLNYLECKDLTQESYEEYINEEGFNVEQAIAATLEDSVLMMKRDNIGYVSVITSLAILALSENIIPDYIIEKLKHIDISNFSEEDKKIYVVDKKYIEDRLTNDDFTIIKDDIYKSRVNMLLQ